MTRGRFRMSRRHAAGCRARGGRPAIGLALAACLGASAIAAAPAAAESLRGPYPIAKLVGPPSSLHRLITEGVECPTAPEPVVTLNFESRYEADDPQKAKIDPEREKAYQESTAPVREYIHLVVDAANAALSEPFKRAAWADCVAGLLDHWAKAGGMTDVQTHSAWLLRGARTAAVALAYLQVRDALAADDPRSTRIVAWLATLAADSRRYIDGNPNAGSSHANHRYWNGLAAAAAGVAAGDRDLLDWGVESARIGLRQVDAQGYLPRELARGKRARDYHFYALGPLTMLAEFAATQGIDLYAAYDGALARLGEATIAASYDSSDIAAAAGAEQVAHPDDADTPPSYRLAWLEPFTRRHPTEAGMALLASKRPVGASSLGGDLTLLFREGLATSPGGGSLKGASE